MADVESNKLSKKYEEFVTAVTAPEQQQLQPESTSAKLVSEVKTLLGHYMTAIISGIFHKSLLSKKDETYSFSFLVSQKDRTSPLLL